MTEASRVARILVREPLQPQVGQARQFVEFGCLPYGEQQDDRLRLDAPGHERQHLGRGLVKPLGVIDQAESGSSSAASDSRLSTAKPMKKRSGGAPLLSPKAVARASALRRRQAIEAIQQRPAQLMQAREREFHLGFNPGHASDAIAGGPSAA